MLEAFGIWASILLGCAVIVIALWKLGIVDKLYSVKKYVINYISSKLLQQSCGSSVEPNEGTIVSQTICDWKVSNEQMSNNVFLQRECGLDAHR